MIAGSGVVAEELRHDAAQAGYEVRSPHDPTGGVLPALIVECDRVPAEQSASAVAGHASRTRTRTTQGGAHLVLCQAGSLGALDPDGSAVGFHVLAPLEQAQAGRADAQRQLLAAGGGARASASSRRWASTWRGSATLPGWCSGGSSAR